MLFLKRRFTTFAKTYENFSTFSDDLSKRVHKLTGPNAIVKSNIDHLTEKFYRLEKQVMHTMLKYETRSRGVWGFIKSFTPGTRAFSARIHLNRALTKVEKLTRLLTDIDKRTKAMEKNDTRQHVRNRQAKRPHSQELPATVKNATQIISSIDVDWERMRAEKRMQEREANETNSNLRARRAHTTNSKRSHYR